MTSVDALCTTACCIALENDVDIFICLTDTGRVASYIAKYKPIQPILACSTSSAVVRQVNTCKGVIGYKIPSHMERMSDKLIGLILKVAKE